MNICQVVPYFPYREHINSQQVEKGYHIGGVERHVYHISRELSQRGHNVTIITTKSPDHDKLSEIESFNVQRVPITLRIYNSHVPFRVVKYFDPCQYDVIHAHTPVPAIADLAALRNIVKKRPFVLTYHNDITKGGIFGSIISAIYNKSVGKFLLQHSDIIISTTKSYAVNSKQLSKYLHKIRVIPNGVDDKVFSPKLDGSRVREKYGLKEDCKIVLFVGRLDYYKGCEYLVEAFSIVVKRMKNAHLILVGSGPLEERLREIANELNITDDISFAGYVKDEDLPYYYAACDVFVLPSISLYEGFGIVQLEAMACGKPVITTTLPGVREVDVDGVATVHIPPKNKQKLAEAIIKILKDDDLATRLGKNGRELIVKKYSWSKVAKAIEQVYLEVVRGC